MKRKFAVVYLDTLQRMKPFDALIYALILPYADKGGYVGTYASLAKLSCASVDQVRRALDRLRKSGDVEVVRHSFELVLYAKNQMNGKFAQSQDMSVQNCTVTNPDECAKLHSHDMANLHNHTLFNNIINNRENNNIIPPSVNGKFAQSQDMSVQNCTVTNPDECAKLHSHDMANLHNHTLFNNIINNRENNNIIPPSVNGKFAQSQDMSVQNCTVCEPSEETQPQPEEIKEPETVTAETEPASSIEQRRYEIILQGIAEQYTERGDIYIPNYVTQTTVALSLVRKVETLMQHYNVADTDDQFADVWRRFLTAGYESGDQFQREHWTLDYIDKQFMAIFNKLNSENNGKQQGTNRSGKGNARISADYVQKVMREAGLAF